MLCCSIGVSLICANKEIYYYYYYYYFGVFYVITRSLLKHTDLNITGFLPKILLFLEDCSFSGLSQDPSDKKASYEIWNYSPGSTLQFALFKIKIR